MSVANSTAECCSQAAECNCDTFTFLSDLTAHCASHMTSMLINSSLHCNACDNSANAQRDLLGVVQYEAIYNNTKTSQPSLHLPDSFLSDHVHARSIAVSKQVCDNGMGTVCPSMDQRVLLPCMSAQSLYINLYTKTDQDTR